MNLGIHSLSLRGTEIEGNYIRLLLNLFMTPLILCYSTTLTVGLEMIL